MKAKIVGIFVCMLLIATVVPAVGTTIEKDNYFITGPHGFKIDDYATKTQLADKGSVLWDNGMHYNASFISQWDPTSFNEATVADDFQFEETTVVTDVHWMGGYWYPGEDADFDWNVSFYMDSGDDWIPGVKIYEEVFPNAMVHETFIEELFGGWMFSYWVDLADPITFTGGEKYWISIQGIGEDFPHSYWGSHFPVMLHDLILKSSYFGYPDWTNSTELAYGNAMDCCFQLTGDGDPVVPDLDCDGDISWNEISPGAVVNSTFMVINNGDVGSMLEWEISEWPDWGTNWSAKWYYEDWLIMIDRGFVGTTIPEEIFVEVTAPEKKNKQFSGEIVLVNSDDASDTCSISVSLATPVNQQVEMYPLLQMILERFPNAFPILRYILGLQ